MQPIDKPLRAKLERTIKEAREVSEAAARAALEQLGVGEALAFAHLSEGERVLRRRLRAHGRQLGDALNGGKVQTMEHLVEETAYEHWHRMLFARFLAENNLLMYPDPDDPVAVTLEECEDLAADEGAANGWELAARFAARMLPQIFRPDSPVFQLVLPPEHQQKLERLVAELPQEVFTASDSLGWVYQFWQSKKKEEVNASEVKIGSRELPAVTQLFTEPYMVSFLLDNSLGAWWATRRLPASDLKAAESEDELRQKAALPGVPLTFLRFVKVEAASRRFPEPEPGYFQPATPIVNLSGNLPHWRQGAVTYFVTFRLADSMPQQRLAQWLSEQQAWMRDHPEPHDDATRQEYYRLFPQRFQDWLDQSAGCCVLELPQVKRLVEQALKHFDGQRYDLDEFVVMPNHVHVVVTPTQGYQLSQILHTWKSFTAHAILKVDAASRRLQASAQNLRWASPKVWQKESFDHIVRSPAQLERIRHYIRENPVKAGLVQQTQRETRRETRQRETRTETRRLAASTVVWAPTAGAFDAWPEYLRGLKVLDPCCGSGHFLVAALLMLVPMRMELEGLCARDAVDAVLRENLHGLDIDQRVTEIAAFALALTAWRYPGAGGYRPLPELHVACSGLAVSVAKEEWKQLAMHKKNLAIAMDWLYDTFCDAPVLGSLLDPATSDAARLVQWTELQTTLAEALEGEPSDARQEVSVVAQGLAKAAQLLGKRYNWVMTNVPYLARAKQNEILRKFCERHYPAAKNDLATVFLERCLQLCEEGGTTSVVLPQNWLFLTSYRKFREQLLQRDQWHLIARLGPGAFETISGEVVKAILLTISRDNAGGSSQCSVFSVQQDKTDNCTLNTDNSDRLIRGLDVSAPRTAAEKAAALLRAEVKSVEQAKQLENPDARVALEEASDLPRLEKYAACFAGVLNGDSPRFQKQFWELVNRADLWTFQQTTVQAHKPFGGLELILYYDKEHGHLREEAWIRRDRLHDSDQRGNKAWGQKGICISQMRILPVSLYTGETFDSNIAVIYPKDQSLVLPIWNYCQSDEYHEEVRRIDQKLNVTNATLIKVPFDLDHWTKIAHEKYPNGLPKPYSDDPTQWIFHGHPAQSDEPLQVAVARLLGYRWPAESRSGVSPLAEKSRDGSSTLELSDAARAWVQKSEALLPYADEDGIVCIPPVRGEASASDQLFKLLVAAYGDAWTNDTLSQLLKQADHAGKTLESWLREKFFTQHCKLFQHRPFIWHIWDGLRDGFAALVNYHKLDTKLLETLIYTYLGDWISRQNQDIANGVDGAEEKLAAAEQLKKKLELILEGEAPYDIFVRWKPIAQQPIGWDPDLNDGVRLNIRPFLSVPDVGKKGAGVLRDKPNINWNKDRGKDVESAPWYHLWHGDRINDHHLSLAEKRAAR